MRKDSIYFKQADLLLQVLPIVAGEKHFALKGGTAINFYFRMLPRISVDIDLCYLPINDRETALQAISESLKKIADRIKRQIPGIQITEKGKCLRHALVLNNQSVTVKIEPNPVLRGCIYKPEHRELSDRAYKTFERYVPMQILSFEDLYAGKLCAALDRQHPRDFFDIKLLFENEGMTEKLRQAFIVYLISHSRPIVELLNPNLIDIQGTFENEFSGMTIDSVTLNDLLDTRTMLIKTISIDLTESERKFLLSFKNKSPDWDLLGLPHIEKLPAVQWKMFNLKKMDSQKHSAAVEKLAKQLGM